jgi:hypothetical protein
MTMEQFAKLRKSDPHTYQKFLDSHQVQERSEVDKLLNFLRGASVRIRIAACGAGPWIAIQVAGIFIVWSRLFFRLACFRQWRRIVLA